MQVIRWLHWSNTSAVSPHGRYGHKYAEPLGICIIIISLGIKDNWSVSPDEATTCQPMHSTLAPCKDHSSLYSLSRKHKHPNCWLVLFQRLADHLYTTCIDLLRGVSSRLQRVYNVASGQYIKLYSVNSLKYVWSLKYLSSNIWVRRPNQYNTPISIHKTAITKVIFYHCIL